MFLTRGSLAVRLSVSITLLLVITIAAITAVSVNREQQAIQNNLEQQAEVQLNTLIGAGGDLLYNLDVQRLQLIMGALGQNHVVVSGRFYDPDGRVIADAYDSAARFSPDIDPLGKRLVQSDTTVFDWQADRLLAGKAVMAGKQRWGALSIALPTAPLDGQIANVRLQGAIAAIAASILGIIVTFILSMTIIAPLREMTRITQYVSQGDLSHQITLRTGGELAILADAFNKMIDRLRALILDLHDRAEDLRRSEAHTRAMINAIPDTILRISGDGTYLEANIPRGDTLVGSPANLIGKNTRDVLPPDLAEERMRYIRRALDTQTLQVYEFQLTLGGQLRDLEGRIVVSGDNEVMLISRDITERKESEAQIRAARDAAEAANRSKSAFLANMSHELRTPLNAILGFTGVLKAGMLKDALPLSVNQLDRLGKIETNGRHLRDLINDILDLAKIEAGRMTLSLSEGNPRAFLRDTVEAMRGLAVGKNLALELSFSPDVPDLVFCDVRFVQQIVTNLIGNAIKFTHMGGIWITVSAPDVANWQISIRDSGIGIPDNAINYIFDSFRQVDQSYQRQYEGTGLGLALVKNMTELMHGAITVQSEMGVGSTFTVTFPIHMQAFIPGEIA
jgi:PAS domain S-box-containing protein